MGNQAMSKMSIARLKRMPRRHAVRSMWFNLYLWDVQRQKMQQVDYIMNTYSETNLEASLQSGALNPMYLLEADE